ncbi:MAG: serine hydroxymethyltransferase [Candidatus ainarchaeum sp.]|nr:serine hydroxymethyltransferase [Candidatus ainarchaeum sp.]
MGFLEKRDPEIFNAIRGEIGRQRGTLELIASENFTSLAVLEAQGCVMTNKYSEGYPGKRYYGGNEFIDVAENLARDRVKKIFNAEHANVQPHSGSSANMEAYFAVLKLGDKILSLFLPEGGHLSHGSPVNFSGQFYKIAHYHLDPETGMLDFDAIRKAALAEKPQMILCGYSAYPRTVDFKAFKEIADEVGAVMMADVAHIAGLIAGGEHPHPFPYADIVTTTTHKTLRGPRGAVIMCREKYAQAVDKAVFPGMQGGPLDHAIAAKAVCFGEAMKPEFRGYARQIVLNAKALADELMGRGFKLVSGGTDNHLMLVDLRSKGCTGKEAQVWLEAAGVTANKNMVPNDDKSPFVTSGIRLGTPALTTRGMKEGEMREIGGMIDRIVASKGDAAVAAKVKGEVSALCARFPLYPELEW